LGEHHGRRTRRRRAAEKPPVSGSLVHLPESARARHGQSCCLQFSLWLAAICGPVPALGLIAQVVSLPFRRGRQAVRLVLWTLGWFVWLFSGHVSFMHALF
jgi:hypothetical protein